MSLREELIARIPSISGNRWTDLNESDTGIVVVELFTSMMEILLFNLDMSLNEAHLPTAVQRRSVNNLVKLIDYHPASVQSARVQVLFDATNHAFGPNTITIPPYTEVSTAQSGGIAFVTTNEASSPDPTPVPIVLTDLKRAVTLNCVEGRKASDIFKSDGLANQRLKLLASGIDSTTILVYVNGALWSPVSSFVSADLSSQVYTTFVDEAGAVYVIFGDGTFGQVPETDAIVQIDYVVSSGASGTVGAGRITALLTLLTDSMDQPVYDVTVSNAVASTPGLAQESIERIKQNAPALLAALFTAKSKGDYNALILDSDPSITKVNTWGEQEESPPNYNLLNKVRMTISGRDSQGFLYDPNAVDPSRLAEYQQVKQNVISYLNAGDRKIITTRNVFIDPVYVAVTITGTIYSDLTKYDAANVLATVKQALVDAFGFDAIAIGQDIYKSQVEKVVNNVVGVSWCNLTITTPGKPTTGGSGLIFRKFEIPVIEDDAITGLVSGADPHIVLSVLDAIDLPVPDPLLEPDGSQSTENSIVTTTVVEGTRSGSGGTSTGGSGTGIGTLPPTILPGSGSK